MPKTPSKDLFDLVKSLHKNEKGYIKKNTFSYNTESDAKFLKLFDAIDNQNDFNEEELRIDDQKIIQLPRLKHYLYEKVLSSLEQFYDGKNIEFQLRHILNQVHVLFDKGFYSQCKKQLVKGKELAVKYEKFTQLLDILEWERVLIIEKLLVNDLFEVANQESDTIEKITNLEFFKVAYDKMAQLYAKTLVIRNRDEEEEFKEIISDKKFENESNAYSLTAKILFYKTHGKYLAALDDKKKYLQYARKALELMERYPEYVSQNVWQYMKVLNNYIVTVSENDLISEWDVAIEKFKRIPANYPTADSEKVRATIFMRVMRHRFYHYHNVKAFEKAFSLIESIDKGLERFDHLISKPHKLMFYYAIAYTYFIEGDLKKALEWANKILNNRISVESQAVHNYARILAIMVHFDLDNKDVLEYLIRATKRSLSKQQKLYHIENQLIVFMEKMIRIDNPKLEHKALVRFKEYLINMNDPLEHNIREYFDFNSWIESKIKGIPFKEALRNRK